MMAVGFVLWLIGFSQYDDRGQTTEIWAGALVGFGSLLVLAGLLMAVIGLVIGLARHSRDRTP